VSFGFGLSLAGRATGSSAPAEWVGLTPLADWNPTNAVTFGSSPVYVSRVTDASGNGNTLTGVSSSEPTYTASNSSFNNKPTLGFATGGATPRASFGNIGIPTNGPMTFILVGKTPDSGRNCYAMHLSNDHAALFNSNVANVWTAWASSDFTQVASDNNSSSAAIILLTLESGSQRIYASSATQDANAASAGATFSGGGLIGCHSTFTSDTFVWGGDIARVLVFGTVLTAAQRTACLTALGSLYGIAIT
jgi:hypothetical protein